MWDIHEMIYGVSSSAEQVRMKTLGEKDECFFYKCFSKFINVRNNIRTFVTKKI